MRIGLGTVQFGLDYGVSNKQGKTDISVAEAIIKEALRSGVDVIDTAALYGDSESVLGSIIPSDSAVKIITKITPDLKDSFLSLDGNSVLGAFQDSINRLNCKSVYGVLVHQATDLFTGGKPLVDLLNELKARGLVEKIGVSVYDADSIDNMLNLFTPDIVQLPVSIADQRLYQSGHLTKLKDHNVEIHARSLFMQGLLLMRMKGVPAFFDPIRGYLSDFNIAVAEAGMSNVEACVRFGLSVSEIDYLIMGVTSISELTEIVAVCNSPSNNSIEYGEMELKDKYFLNPANWVNH